MPKTKPLALDFEVDKLTNSIENTITGDSFSTEVSPVTAGDLAKIKRDKTWLFDWEKEQRNPKSELYKLTIAHNPHVIQGLMCIEVMPDHIHIHLLESAKFNLGRHKIYVGVPGNLVAYACKLAFEKGFEGNVAFIAKTKLIEHYEKTLGAFSVGSRIIVATIAAQRLVDKYFNN